MNYLFELTKNFGIAIVLVTAAVRLLFFPLANYSFRSMAKMKILQPELLRLKELHKEDKVKLQQEMMALYKREKSESIVWMSSYFNSDTFLFCNIQNAIHLIGDETSTIFWLD